VNDPQQKVYDGEVVCDCGCSDYGVFLVERDGLVTVLIGCRACGDDLALREQPGTIAEIMRPHRHLRVVQ
jgi:hypothetical protein